MDSLAPSSVWASYPVRLIVLSSLAVIAAILTATWILLANLRSEQITENERDLESLSLVLAEQLDRSFQSIEVIQADIADRMKNLGIASTAELERQMSGYDTHERFKDQIAALPHIDAIVLTDPEGKLINFSRSWPIPHVQNTTNNRDHVFKTSNLQTYVEAALKNPATGAWVLPIARKISGPKGEFLGAVLGVIRLDYFERLFEKIARSSDRSISLFTRDGTLIARYPRSESLRGRSYAGRDMMKLLQKISYGTIQRPAMLTGKKILISGRNLPHYPMSIVITKRLDDVLAGWHYAALDVASAALMIVLLVASTAFLITRRVAKNLKAQNQQLDAALNNMSQGLTMFDASARLIVCNKRYVEMYNLPEAAAQRGASLRDLVRLRIVTGLFSTDLYDPDGYVDAILADINQGKPKALLCELSDGRAIAVMNQPMPGGGWVATHEDITESRRREASFQLLFENNPVPMWVYDLDNLRFLAVNAAAVANYGYSYEQFLQMTTLDIRPADERERFVKFIRDAGGDHNSEQIWRHQKANGTIIDVGIYARSLNYIGRKACLVAAHDITNRKRAEEQLRRTQKFLDAVIENVPVPILVKDIPMSVNEASGCRYSLVNKALEKLFGISRDQIVGKTISDLYPKERADFIIAENNEALRSSQPVIVSDHTVHTPRNGVRIAIGRTVVVRNDDENTQSLITVLQDVTERRQWERRLARMAHYDNLTDLPNRITFNDAMEAALERSATSGEQFAVLSLDLDGFKEANDRYGHTAGDTLLCAVARRLQEAAAESFVARIGGDEFVLIVPGAKQPEAATAVARRALDALSGEITVDGCNLMIGATIGGAIYPRHGTDAKSLMANADIALYRAKAVARGTLMFFDADMGDRLRERRAMQDDLRLALGNKEFLLHYQPQKKMTGQLVGFEALLRWQSPGRGLVPPNIFIPIAEDAELIAPIGEWVLREACREAASWPRPLTIAVNVSPVQFRNSDLPELVHSILLETGLAPSRLELEITEGALIDNFSRAKSILARLKSLGVRISLDDFGTGYSSLSYLHAFSFDKIKIDRSFVADLDCNHNSIAIVRAIIDLGHSLDVPILAEGVETAEQHANLFRKGCDEVQGYFTGRPSPIDDYAKLLGREAPAQPTMKIAG